MRTCLLPVALLLCAAAPLAAQAPGYQQLDNRTLMAEYRAEVLRGVNDHLARWGEAWGEDRIEDLVELYWDDAVLVPPGAAPLRGRSAIHGHLSEVLPAQGRVEAFMLDFDASGGMAVVFGNYTLEEGGVTRSGPLVTVYVQRGRAWRIRTQVFLAS